MATFIHVGQSAGQNLGHAHWHLMEVLVRKPLECPDVFGAERVVHVEDKFMIVANGAHAGECLIAPRDELSFDKDAIKELASALEWIVNRGNKKFRSTEGLPPEFTVSVRIGADGKFRYADYCPILNTWGACENVFAPLEGGPITLCWPHDLTATYLRE